MRKVSDTMPLLVARYLADTAHLSNAMSGSYMHALMHQWLTGPLPDDMEACARIMKIEGLGAPDIARALLKSFFVQDENACWIQLNNQRIKAEETAKALKYSERAKRANEIRWQGHVAKYPTRTLQGVQGGILVESKNESLKTPNGVPLVQVPKRLKNKTIGSLRSPGGQPAAGSGLNGHKNPSAEEERSQGEVKTRSKPSATSRAPVSTNGHARVDPAGGKAAKTAPVNGDVTLGKPAKPVDPRFVPFRREFSFYWKKQNPGGLKYAWEALDGRALNNLLRRYKQMDLTEYRRLLTNRAQSDNINPSEAPAAWIGRLVDYSSGPLSKYGRLKP